MTEKIPYFDTIKSPKTLVSVWHARGNQGAVIAVKIIAQLTIDASAKVSSFGIFGAEKGGAPIMAFNRISAKPIEAFYAPNRFDIVVILDPSIQNKETAPGYFLSGTNENTVFVVNTPQTPEAIARELELGPARIITVDATGIAAKLMKKGFQFPNTAMLGAVIHLFPEFTLEALNEGIKVAPLIANKGKETVDVSIRAAEEGYNTYQEFDGRGTDIPRAQITLPKVLNWWEFAPGGAIIHTGNAYEKKTGTWRTERPIFTDALRAETLKKGGRVKEPACTNCQLCYQFCPDFAIKIEDGKVSGIDYEHCKGCLICYNVCKFSAIGKMPEARAKK